jgi:hypothetical protein
MASGRLCHKNRLPFVAFSRGLGKANLNPAARSPQTKRATPMIWATVGSIASSWRSACLLTLAAYPVCTGGERPCPPEDCGGIPGILRPTGRSRRSHARNSMTNCGIGLATTMIPMLYRGRQPTAPAVAASARRHFTRLGLSRTVKKCILCDVSATIASKGQGDRHEFRFHNCQHAGNNRL